MKTRIKEEEEEEVTTTTKKTENKEKTKTGKIMYWGRIQEMRNKGKKQENAG